MREAPESTSAGPQSLADAGEHVDERDRPAKRTRDIDCSVAHAERHSAPKSGQGARAHQGSDARKADTER